MENGDVGRLKAVPRFSLTSPFGASSLKRLLCGTGYSLLKWDQLLSSFILSPLVEAHWGWTSA